MKFYKGFVALFIFLLSLSTFSQTSYKIDFKALSDKFSRIRTYDVKHYKISIDFDRENKKVLGEVIIQLQPLKKSISSIELDASGFDYDFVGFEDGKSLKFEQKNEKLLVYLDRTYQTTETIFLKISYSCRPKKGVYFVEANDKGRIKHDAQIWTQNEPEEAHYWFPSYDFPDDKATSEQFLTVLRDEVAIANGKLIEITEKPDGRRVFHYKMDLPHPVYLISFVIGKYSKLEDNYKNIPLGFYVYPGTEEIAKNAFAKTKDMFRIFEEVTGMDYPFNKYDQTIVAKFRFGGMENITATTLADTEILSYDVLKDRIEDLISHELAHSWFGNLVTCRNWAELWLNEGFASFMEAVYRERMYGQNDYLRKIAQDALEYISYESATSSSTKFRHGLFNQLARPDDSIFDPIAYQKGSVVIHTLRKEIGDDAFWLGVRNYLKAHRFDNVGTADLKQAMESASGKNLDWFFYQWVYMAGFPKLEVRPVFYKKSGKLDLIFTQKQQKESMVPEVFILPLEIEVQTSQKAYQKKIKLAKKVEIISLKVAEKPQKILIDKNFKIPLVITKVSSLEVREK
ncbi:MAG: M1 family peptidase [Acidobacteria bacterium]|nr:MAG: M1 family peptidase [Acidobacteriota bacterium]